MYLALAALVFPGAASAKPRYSRDNPAIDMEAHLRLSQEAAAHRESHRVSEEEFLNLSKQQGVVILDARSERRFNELHIRDAVNLSFSDITEASLRKLFPDKKTRILIYCNNNFTGSEQAFPTKAAPASLNLSTYVTLYTYGYRNIFELAPLLDVANTKLELVGTEANK